MKSLCFLALGLCLIAAGTTNASNESKDGAPTLALTTEIIRIKAEAFARALVDLKLREVALNRNSEPDLVLVREQIKMVETELSKLDPSYDSLAELEKHYQDLCRTYKPGHIKVQTVAREIERRKAFMAPAK